MTRRTLTDLEKGKPPRLPNIPPAKRWDKEPSTEYKGFQIYRPDTDREWVWAIETDVPSLQGKFTKLILAQRQIDLHLASLERELLNADKQKNTAH